MKNKIKKNFVYLSIYKVFEMLIPMISSPFLSRALGASSLGLYSYSYSIVSFFVILAELGCYRYGLREIAKVRDDKEKLQRTYSDIFWLHFFNGLIILIVYFLFNYIIGQFYYMTIILSLFLISNMIDNSFLFVGLENVGPMTLRDSAIKIITFVLILLFIKQPEDVYIYALIMSVGAFICKLIALMYSFRYAKIVKPDLKKCLKHYKPMAFLMIPALASVAYQSMDKIMIGNFFNNEDVGFYECASKALIPRNIISALGTVLCPGIANLYINKEIRKINVIIEKSFSISMVLSYIFMFGICGIAKEFAPWFWGNDFSPCSNLLIGLSITIPIWTVGEVIRNQYLLPIGKDKEYTSAFVIGVIINAIFNVILIPSYGAYGAIIATIIAELAMSIIQVVMVKKDIPIFKYLLKSIPYFIGGLIMLICIRLFANINIIKVQSIKLLVEIIIGILSYTIFIIIYESISNNYLILDIIKKKIGGEKI